MQKKVLILTVFILFFTCLVSCSADQDMVIVPPPAEQTPHLNKSDSTAMVAIYNEIGPWGNEWDLKDIQTWGGVTASLDLSTNEYRITRFNYPMGNYHGTFPDAFRQLTELRVLIVAGGDLSGPIPSWIGELTNLFYLVIGDNNMDGSIPSEIGKLTNLENLRIANCQIGGTLPETLGNLTKLTRLEITDCNVDGEIPKTLANLRDSTIILFNNTKLSGTFPIEILHPMSGIYCTNCNITNLPFEVWNDDFIGAVPDLQGNKLTGIIPDSVFTTKQWESSGWHVCRQKKGYGYTNYNWKGETDSTIE